MRFILDEELEAILILYKEENWVSLGEKWEIISLNSFFLLFYDLVVVLWLKGNETAEKQAVCVC